MQEIETKAYLANGAQPEADEAVAWAFEQKAQMVDLKFTDLFGAWQHMTLPVSAFGTSAFTEGLGFDGSSIRGWQGIARATLLMPDPASACSSPFTERRTVARVRDRRPRRRSHGRRPSDRPPRG